MVMSCRLGVTDAVFVLVMRIASSEQETGAKSPGHSFKALFLSTPSSSPGNAIEFSTDLKKFVSEGLVCQCLIFRDDARTIYYQPPDGWICTLIGKHLYLKPPNQNFAAAEIKAIPLPALRALDDMATAALVREVLSTVPAGSQERWLVKQELNPVALDNNESFEVIVSYEAPGATFQRSVLFVNAPANQLIFKFTARADIFDDLYCAFRNSILTWEWHSAGMS
jgi:hypothetical protein